MGCCGSASKTGAICKDRLDAVEQDLISHAADPSQGPGAGLSDMARCAQELKDVMDLLIQDGAKDANSMQRVERLSDSVLANLRERISSEFLTSEDAKRILDDIMAVSRTLDAVRATKASGAIRELVDNLQAEIKKSQEKENLATVAEVRAVVDKIKEIKLLVPGMTRARESTVKIFAKQPENKSIIDLLLKSLIALAEQALNMQKEWVVQPTLAKAVFDEAEKIDETADKLVLVLGSKWDPRLSGQVRYLSVNQAKAVCARQLTLAERELAEDSGGKAYDALEVMVPWWPFIKDIGAFSVQVVGTFSKVQTFASEAFMKAADIDDKESEEAIRAFAKKFDSLRMQFEGIAPAENEGLLKRLDASEASARSLKQIKVLDGEIAKTCDDDKSTNLSLATTIQAMDALTTYWPSTQADASVVARMETTCNSLEAWAEAAARACALNKVDSLLKFAEEYDKRRVKLVPPAPKKGSLHPRIACHAVNSHLKAVENELSKATGLNPNLVLDGLHAAAMALPSEGETVELKSRLTSCFDLTAKRVLDRYRDAVAACDSRKVTALHQFASKFDGLREEAEGDSHAGLARTMQHEIDDSVKRKFDSMDAELSKTMDVDISKVQKTMVEVESLWPGRSERSDLNERLSNLIVALEERLMERCTRACDDAKFENADSLLELARGLDDSMRRLCASSEPPEIILLRAPLIVRIFDARVEWVTKTLKQPGAFDSALILKELAAARSLLEEGRPSEPICDLVSLCESMNSRLTRQLLDADKKAQETIFLLAKAADALCRTAGTKLFRDVGLDYEFKSNLPVVTKLTDMKAELSKTSGMNPKFVVEELNKLLKLWPLVAGNEDFCNLLTDALNLFHERLKEACEKALAVDNDHVKALLSFTEDADKAQAALETCGGSLKVRSFHKSTLRVVVAQRLSLVEAELSKTSGMNSAAILKTMREIAEFSKTPSGTDDSGLPDDTEAEQQVDARLQQIDEKVRSRMQESLRDTLEAANTQKRDALLKFAEDFDASRNGSSNVRNHLETILQEKASTSASPPAASKASASPPVDSKAGASPPLGSKDTAVSSQV